MARTFASGDQVSIANSALFDGAVGSVAIWLKTTSAAATMGICSRNSPSGSFSGFTWFLNNTAGKQTAQFKFGSATENTITGSKTVNDGNWHLLGLVLDQSNSGIAQLWVDGVLDASGANAAAWAFSGQPVDFGAVADTFWARFVGSMGPTAWWNVKLDASQWAAMAGGEHPLKIAPANLMGMWAFDGVSSSEFDYSGNLNAGTLTGTSYGEDAPPVRAPSIEWYDRAINSASAASFLAAWALGSNQVISGGVSNP